MATRDVRIGCEFVYDAEVATSTIFQVTPLGTDGVAISGEEWSIKPELDSHEYRDLYGNRCQRMVLPPGRSEIRYSAVARVPDATEDADESAPELPPHELPDDVIVYTMPSRFCLPDMLGTEAWTRFSHLPTGYSRVQAICQHVNGHLQFAYGSSSPTSTAVDVNLSGFGVCRDFTHLAITFCRAMNIPAQVRLRLPAGHGRADRPGADGFRRLDGGVAGRPVVDVRPAEQRSPQGPDPHRAGPGRLRRGHGDVVRRTDAADDAGRGTGNLTKRNLTTGNRSR